MRKTIKSAIAETVTGLMLHGIETSFTEKELKELGVKITAPELNGRDTAKIRKKVNLSQAVFARLLNVSSSTVRQWEQGKRNPTGSTKVLLDLLRRNPEILNYRFKMRNRQQQL